MYAFATVDDLEVRWRTLSDDEKVRADVLLGDASSFIRIATGRSYENADNDTLDILCSITCNMVKRVMTTPIDQPALNSWQQNAGSYNESFGFANPTGDMYLTAAEKKLLGIGTAKFMTISPSRMNGRICERKHC